jgi:hypothetical protein
MMAVQLGLFDTIDKKNGQGKKTLTCTCGVEVNADTFRRQGNKCWWCWRLNNMKGRNDERRSG